MLVAFGIRPYGANHGVVAEHHSVDVDDQQLDFIAAPAQKGVYFNFCGFDHLPTRAGLGRYLRQKPTLTTS